MTFNARCGETLLIPSGPAHDPGRRHLFIVLTDPLPADSADATPHVVVVSICSIVAGQNHDATCELGPGDHPFVDRPSFVDYSTAYIVAADKLIRRCRNGEYIRQPRVSSALLARIQEGMMRSRHSRPRPRGLCRLHLHANQGA